MKWPPNTSVPFVPLSPTGAPYEGITGSDGNVIVVDGNPYVYNGETGRYDWQEPGNPPGDWWYYERVGDHYVKSHAEAEHMVRRSEEVGANA